MSHSSIRLDPQRRDLIVNDRREALVEKTWQVFKLLIDQAPKVIPRRQFIDEIWGGNWLVGDKNLNQAIWSLRRALSDQSRAPTYIRTVPREGYQWIGARPLALPNDVGVSPRPVRRRVYGAAAVFVLSALTGLLFSATRNSPVNQSGPQQEFARSAVIVGGNVHVHFESGLLGVLENEGGRLIGTPALSKDGSRIAIPLKDGENCELITIDLNTRERLDYRGCPTGTAG